MKALRYITGFLALAALLVLVGCGGSSPGLDPVINFNFGDTTLPNMNADTTLEITATAGVASGDKVIDVDWTEVEQPGGGTIGLFSSPTTLNTTWVVTDPASILAPTPVTLLLRVETLNGGETETPIFLIINPVVPAP
ncbi:MAG: hypothetical protein ACYDCO_02135 [Armatimonadota bacterium]